MQGDSEALWLDPQPLVLASTSSIRRQLLTAAGLPPEIEAPSIDERRVEAEKLEAGATPADAAVLLACEKALDVSRRRPGRLVVGADQTLALADGSRLSKPRDTDDAAHQLARLAGTTHTLCSACAIARDGAILFSAAAEARLTMRPLSEAFIRRYLALAGRDALGSVGGYQLEGLGIHLFERIDGDHFTILGLPLMPLLEGLRTIGALAR
ncbi:Maf family protein [Chelatococcus composti]|jgi:septum formation protein|uniref:Nucleoside triphosphate pyrophosphatase n=1 Tax=Chelatococcus composti TaxID=1743235 RepID=A0A841KBU5_9HYPH|nr:Maf family protein [Chelatococcus composti]MBB6167476.1 septum formation protein [Chelatococcus composti]MBS7735681.1 Maf family protein [Chelatococcus composti]PZN44632.1 MAG: septum formation inhibitor Maf [Pseudomonadota bacterium]GGG32222.1 Maf-like protein [Chelatococcus composti]